MIPGKKIWMNGQLINWAEATVHVINHSMHYGSAVFEGVRFYETDKGIAIFRNADHVKRLFYSGTFMEMVSPYTEKEVQQAQIDVVKNSELKSGYIRPIFFLTGKMGVPTIGCTTELAVACWGWGKYLDADAVRVKTSKWRRIPPNADICDAKIAGHYFNPILASCEAKKGGYDEALMLDQEDYIAEGPGENLFIIKNSIIYTPEATKTFLPGITRSSVMQIATDLGLEVKEAKLKLADLYDADEAFFTGTAAEVQPIADIDDKKIKNRIGNITSKLREVYLDTVHGKVDKYLDWLTFVN